MELRPAAAPASPRNAGHGNAGVDPAMLTHHGVPASDAGHQGGQDEAAAAAQIKRTAKNSPLAQMAV
jgi:hypothetical protein